MKRGLALLWLAVVVVAAAYLAWRAHDGLVFRTDLMALLPREERDPALQMAKDRVSDTLSRRIMVLVGNADRGEARAAAAELTQRLVAAQLVDVTTDFEADRLTHLGKLYFPYRRGLLSEDDRRLLREGRAQDIVTRTLSQVYGFVGMTDARLLRNDPFLLMPSFFAGLPLPLSRLTLDDGMLSLTDHGTTWVLVSGRLDGEPFALDVQRRLADVFGPAVRSAQAGHPGTQVLRLGAVFFATDAARQAMDETSAIGIASTIGTVLLVLAAFRALTALWLSLLVIGTGVVTALAACLLAFGQLHVGALLFGVSLIGVAVDYSLQYCSEAFAPDYATPPRRLRRVGMGITLGAATTIIGYLTLFLAPFPGLHQVAAFSAVGLLASWTTVVLWLPRLDVSRRPRHGRSMLTWAARFLALWEDGRHRRLRLGLVAVAVVASAAGALRLHADDDVRRMQSLSPNLLVQQDRLQRLIGHGASGQFFLVRATDDETALRREEALAERLRPLVADRALAGFQAAAQYVPSAERQRANRALVHRSLDGAPLEQQRRQLGLEETAAPPDDNGPVLTLAEATATGGPLGFLSLLVMDGGGTGDAVHLVTLDGVADAARVAASADGLDGVRLVDPTGDFSTLLGKYRNRAIALLVVSAILMAPLLAWRYGIRGGLAVMLPPLLAVALTPGLRALGGGAFTFFDAMALVLVLSIGVDYAVFCAETEGDRKPVTMLAVALAASTALMSFGLLALSSVLAVHTFGTTMAVGIVLSFFLSPLSRLAKPPGDSRSGHWAVIGERGTLLGLRIARGLYALTGKRGCMAVLWLAVAYFYVSEAGRRRNSLDFLARAHAAKGLAAPGWRDGLRHYLSFAEKAVETVIAWADPDRSGPVEILNAEPIDRMAAAAKGGLLIVSHLGNAELCRARLRDRFGRDINVLLHTRHAVHYNRILRGISPDVAANTIQVTELGPETAIQLKERIERGDWIAIAGDRIPVSSSERTSRVPFLGQPAAFSHGPFILAALMGCPVYLMFCLRHGDGHRVAFEPFAERIVLPRRDRAAALTALAGRYAARLEHYCLQAPLQWYNFFDFWA